MTNPSTSPSGSPSDSPATSPSGTPSGTPSGPPSAIENAGNTLINGYRQHVQYGLSGVTDSIAQSVDRASEGSISSSSVKGFMPYVAAGGIGLIGYLLTEPLRKGESWLSQIAGYVLPAITGFLGFQLFSSPDRVSNAVKTEYHHTGRVGQAPQTTQAVVTNPQTQQVIDSQNVPVRPAPAPALSEQTSQTAEELKLKEKKQAEIRQLRLDAITANNQQLDSALQEYMAHNNQMYENRRLFVEESDKFRAGPRQKLMDALKRVGMSPAEAEAFVPNPPVLQAKIYENGTDFPPELVIFAKKFESTYGQSGVDIRTQNNVQVFTFVDQNGSAPRRKTWDEMSVTQREEFLAKAIAFTNERQKFFETLKRSSTGSAGPGAPGYTSEYYDYKDRKGQTWILSTPPDGESFGIKWPAEHAMLKEVVGVSESRSRWGHFIKTGGNLNDALTKWREQQTKSDAHKEMLANADGKVNAYSQSVELMQARLKVLKEKGILVVGQYESNGQQLVQIKDCRNPDCAQSATLSFKPLGDGRYEMTEWKNGMRQGNAENGGPEFAALPWQKPVAPIILSADEYKALVEGRGTPELILDAQKVAKPATVARAPGGPAETIAITHDTGYDPASPLSQPVPNMPGSPNTKLYVG